MLTWSPVTPEAKELVSSDSRRTRGRPYEGQGGRGRGQVRDDRSDGMSCVRRTARDARAQRRSRTLRQARAATTTTAGAGTGADDDDGGGREEDGGDSELSAGTLAVTVTSEQPGSTDGSHLNAGPSAAGRPPSERRSPARVWLAAGRITLATPWPPSFLRQRRPSHVLGLPLLACVILTAATSCQSQWRAS